MNNNYLMDNKIILYVIILIIILNNKINLDNKINILNNKIIVCILLTIIIYISNINFNLSLILSLFFIILKNNLTKKEINETYDNLDKFVEIHKI